MRIFKKHYAKIQFGQKGLMFEAPWDRRTRIRVYYLKIRPLKLASTNMTITMKRSVEGIERFQRSYVNNNETFGSRHTLGIPSVTA